MLDKKVEEIVYENGVAVGVKADGETAKAKTIIGDPSYFPGKVHRVGKVIRAICLLAHPIPNTDNADSVQLIIPQNQVGRRHGIIPLSPSPLCLPLLEDDRFVRMVYHLLLPRQ